ncbi:MAG: zeta toxin family protein [Burkholderiales bacterium]
MSNKPRKPLRIAEPVPRFVVGTPPRIYVLAGVNGAGKSSVGGAAIRAAGGDYYNPDEAARECLAANPGLAQTEANSQAWQIGRRLLEKAIVNRLDFSFETTLGAHTLPAMLCAAALDGFEVHIWYVGLTSAELHLARVKARVEKGGHDIPEADIRRRYHHSRRNLIDLLPQLAALRVYDNSHNADPAMGNAPKPALVLHRERGAILNKTELANTPDWAKPIVAAALKLGL